jgi:hypothetical protein
MKKIYLPIILAFLFVTLSISSWAQATLPLTTTTLSKSALPQGFSHVGLGTDYSGGSLKFDSQDDSLTLHFTGAPGILSFEMGTNNSFPGTIPELSVFSVQESSNGTTFTDVASYTNGAGGVKTISTLNSTTRYIKWVHSSKLSGTNFALKNIELTAGVAAAFTVSSTSIDESCNGLADGSLSITVTGGTGPYTYLWENGNATDNNDALAAGTHSLLVTITDNNGAGISETAAVNATIGSPAAITISETITPNSCGGSNGSITVTVAGGSGAYTTYAWSPDQGSATTVASNLPSGTHTITVTDDSGCAQANSFVMNPTGGPAVAFTTTNISCNGLTDGMIAADATGGSGSYTFTWSEGTTATGVTSSTLSGLSEATYSLTVTDANCSSIISTDITNPAVLTATITSTNETAENSADGTVTVVVEGGPSGTYSYSWSPTGSGSSLSNLEGGEYSVTVTDGACSFELSTSVTGMAAYDSTKTIYEIQYAADGGDSPFLEKTVKVKGVVTAFNTYAKNGGDWTKNYRGYWLQDGDSAWSGIWVRDTVNYTNQAPSGGVFSGDSVQVTAIVREAFGYTVLEGITSFDKYYAEAGSPQPVPVELTTIEAAHEKYEGVLVKISAAKVLTDAGDSFGDFQIQDNTGTMLEVDNLIFWRDPDPIVNDIYNLTGIMYYGYETRSLMPRKESDYEIFVGIEELATLNLTVYPNPSNGIINITSTENIDYIRVVDIRGAVVFNQAVNNQFTSLDLTNVAKGFYNIQVVSGSRINNSKVVIK